MPAPTGSPSFGAGRGRVSVTETTFDLRHHAVVGIEELLLDLVPAADVADREQPRTHREAEELDHARADRAVSRLREQLLRGGRVEELHERLRGRLVLARRQDGDGVLDA